ncbi:MAG: NYN domain-containing protein [Egibacteraceae bacterium]
MALPSRPRRLIVDGMNVIGSRPDGWWRDREGAARRLVEQLRAFADRTGDEVTVVFDGGPSPDLAEGLHGSVMVRYASREGPDAADDRIVRLVAADPNPATLEVVTADARLRERVLQLDATVSGPRTFRRELDS